MYRVRLLAPRSQKLRGARELPPLRTKERLTPLLPQADPSSVRVGSGPGPGQQSPALLRRGIVRCPAMLALLSLPNPSRLFRLLSTLALERALALALLLLR